MKVTLWNNIQIIFSFIVILINDKFDLINRIVFHDVKILVDNIKSKVTHFRDINRLLSGRCLLLRRTAYCCASKLHMYICTRALLPFVCWHSCEQVVARVAPCIVALSFETWLTRVVQWFVCSKCCERCVRFYQQKRCAYI